MSIFVQQPHRRVRPLSGLGAFAAMHQQILREGTGAFLNADVCDFEALVQRVAAELGVRGEYRGNPALAQHDAALYAHEIYEANCPSAQTYVENNYYGSSGGWGWWGGGGRRRHRGGGGGGHHWGGGGGHPHDMVARSAPSTMDVRTMPSSSSSRPVSSPHRYATQANPSQHRSYSHAMHAQPQHGTSRAAKMRGLGDGEMIPGLMFDQRLNRPSTMPNVAQPQTLTAIQQRVTATVAPQMTMSNAGGDDSSGGLPTSFSIEGALPGGVALLLGAAIGLLGVSFLGGK